MATEYCDNDVFNAYGVKEAEALSNTSPPAPTYAFTVW